MVLFVNPRNVETIQRQVREGAPFLVTLFRLIAMASVFCDPNYDPYDLYRGIEPLLFLYERVYLFAPSHGQMSNVGLDSNRLYRLIQEGFVVPVARQWWFTQNERESRMKNHPSDSDKRKTYVWTPFDDKILQMGEITKSGRDGPAYIVLPDEITARAEQIEASIDDVRPHQFRSLVHRARELRESRRLPKEIQYLELDEEKTARKIVYYAAGDTLFSKHLGAASIFTTPEMGTIYGAVSRSFPLTSYATERPIAVVDPLREYRLTNEEVQIALRLAKSICGDEDFGPMDLELLKEYRQSNCYSLFRDFVSNGLQGLGHLAGAPDEQANALKAAFDGNVDFVATVAKCVPSAAGITLAEFANFLIEQTTTLPPASRLALVICAAVAFTLFAEYGATAHGDRIASKLAAPISGPRYETLFAIARRQRDG